MNCKQNKDRILFDNCEIYSPDNKLIGLCGKRRFNWYLSKNLAEKIETKENAIRLKFEPKRNDAYIVKRENKCYVCGSVFELIRFNIIPKEYKKLLPEEWKSRKCKTLPLCKECSSQAYSYIQDLKYELQEEYDIYDEDFYDQDLKNLKYLSKKIINNRKYGIDNKNLITKINSKLGHDVSEEELQKYSNCNTYLTIDDTKSPCEYIVKQIILENDIENFVRRWKDHFIKNMKPYDLPEDFYENY